VPVAAAVFAAPVPAVSGKGGCSETPVVGTSDDNDSAAITTVLAKSIAQKKAAALIIDSRFIYKLPEIQRLAKNAPGYK
jgi:hypothetical protein